MIVVNLVTKIYGQSPKCNALVPTCRTKFRAKQINKMLYVVGLGLGDVKDITVKGLEIVKSCELIYLESYTSILTCGKEEMVREAAFL